ncbi:replication terminator protein [Paenibacillus alba]|uniref:replication terminator protein n=1 Tax=Paenibacillus alba TaxID=1197127 RepID=UPI0015678E38|nr:replication terminator protein [Paenibacillus alba]NQX67955.1 replication terminator protein [Paenibacillus alba]
MHGIDINTLSGGAVAERINRELQRVAENILDPNTNAAVARTVTVTIKIKPDESRQIGVTDIQIKSGLAPTRGIPAQFIFDYGKDGKAVMAELRSSERNQFMVDDDGDVADDRGKKVVNGNFR